MWSVAEAKAQLSEILRQARTGTPQFIGAQDPCVVISLATYETKVAEHSHDGLWLLQHASKVATDIILPDRAEDRDTPVLGD
jgi:prevent-host-death family protein